MPVSNVTTAPTVTARGRSPGASGSSCARTAAFLASERDSREGRGAGAGRGVVVAGALDPLRRFLLRLPTDRLPDGSFAEGRRRSAGVRRITDGAHYRDPLGTDLVCARCVD